MSAQYFVRKNLQACCPGFKSEHLSIVVLVLLIIATLLIGYDDVIDDNIEKLLFSSRRAKRIALEQMNKEYKDIVAGLLAMKSQQITLVTSFSQAQRKQMELSDHNGWMGVFANIRNPVLIYTDDHEIAHAFINTRKHANLAPFTAVVIIPQESLWSYQLLPDMMQFYSTVYNTSFPVYAKTRAIEVNTFLSKFNFIEDAVYNNYFKIDQFLWLDINYLYNIPHGNGAFDINIPRDLPSNSVGISKLTSEPLHSKSQAEFEGLEWIKSGIYVANGRTFSAFCRYIKETSVRFYRTSKNDSDKLATSNSKDSFHLRFYSNLVKETMIRNIHS